MKNRHASFVVFLLCLAVLACFFPKELSRPNSTYFGYREDGLKNYYSLDYHLKYDTSALHFEGMNYPFGEHIVFTDGQPLLSVTLWVLKTPFPGIAGYTVGIMNILMLLGVCWGAVLLFKIFRHYEVPLWLAGGAAVLLALMAPQMLRINLHYALAYSFFIPWIIYRMILFAESASWKNSLAIMAVMFLALGLHLYYLVIMGFLVGAFYLLLLFAKETQLKWPAMLLHLFLQVVLPLGIFMTWMKMTDPVMDRPSAPYGMMEFRAMWEGVFLPLEMPAGDWIRSLVKIRAVSFEAVSYVGFAATVFFVFWLFSSPRKAWRERFNRVPRLIKSAFYASFIVFLFAAIYPLLFEYSWIAGISGPLKQFRSMGRLSWVFFYGLNLYLVFYVSGLWISGGRKQRILVFSIMGLMALETFAFLAVLSDKSGFDRKTYLLPSDDFKGKTVIFPSPYFHNGSENLGTPTAELYLAERTMEISGQSGLPTFGVLLSRTSIAQTLQQLELSMNLSGPLLAAADRWLLLEDTGYSDTIRKILEPARMNVIYQEPYFTSLVNVSDVKALLNRRKEYTLLNLDSSRIIEKDDMNNGDVPGLEGNGKQLRMDREHQLYSVSSYQGPDSVRFVFWLKADADGLRGYKIIFRQEGEKDKHYRLEWCYSNVVNGYVRLEVAETPVKGKACSLSLDYDRPDMLPEMVIDQWLVIPDGASYAYVHGPFLFTRNLVYY